jgi:hypothetical protein
LVKDIRQMVSLVDESVAKHDAAVAANQRLRERLRQRVESVAAAE